MSDAALSRSSQIDHRGESCDFAECVRGTTHPVTLLTHG